MRAAFFGAFNALAVDDAGGRTRWPIDQLATLLVKFIVNSQQCPVVLPALEVVEQAASRRQVSGDIAPLAPGAQNIQKAIHHLAFIGQYYTSHTEQPDVEFSPIGTPSRRLWSLLDMMRFYAKPFLEADRLITQLIVASQDQNVTRFSPDALAHIHSTLVALVGQLDAMKLRISRLAVENILNRLRDDLAPSELKMATTSVWERVRDEMEIAFLLHLSAQEQEMYEATAPFGADVAMRFPGAATYEIEEASKCLALGRSTAAAFHAIRCLEAGIRAMSRCLGIPNPTKAADRNWGRMLGTIKAELDRRWPTSSDRLAGDGQIFEEAYAALAAMNNPWRNATMHLDHKYTEEEARHVFDVVRGFMQRLASRCDEEGNPQA